MRTVDLFAGCGGLSLGFQNAGYEIAAAFDHWSSAAIVYRRNFTHPIYEMDLRDDRAVEEITRFVPELIIGGPPCQDFSSAGKRDETLGRADLTLTFAKLVTHIKPRYFVMENVERIITSAALKKVKDTVRQAGYGLTEAVLNASFYGVPQDRKRYFLVGDLNGTDDALLPYLTKRISSKPMTIFDYLGNDLGIEYYYRHPRSYARRAVFSIYEPSPTIRGVNRPIPKNYKPHPGDASQNITSLRPLTTIERSYLQTFPKSFIFEGSKTALEQMIGNAVPVKLAEFVAASLQLYIRDQANEMSPSETIRQLMLL